MSVINNISASSLSSGFSEAVQPQVQAKKAVAVDKPKEVQKPEKKQEAPIENENLSRLIDRANIQMAGAGNQHLSFGYEERLNRLYVQIKDNATGEVVREIPPRKLIEQQAAMSEMIGIILDRNA